MNGSENALTRKEIIEELRRKAGLSSREAGSLVEALLESVSLQLEKGGAVSLSGFGRFEARLTPTRPGRNPATGEKVIIPERLRPVFTLSRAVRSRLKGDRCDES